MLTKRYMTSTKNVPAIMQKIVSGTAPEHFTYEHLKNIGFTSSADRGIIPVLKDLGFLTSDGTPTQRYHDYRNAARSKKVMGDALRDAYQEVFHIDAKPTKADRKAIEGLFKSTHNVTDNVAEFQAMTFFALLDLADLSEKAATINPPAVEVLPLIEKEHSQSNSENHAIGTLSLRYNVEIHLPATKDIEVYNAIFKSLKENLID